MSTFDYSFDRTFREILTDNQAPPTQEGCRKNGVYLTWLTLQGGWQYWLFESSVQRGKNPSSVGAAVQGGLVRPTQRKTSQSMVLHTANLTEAEAEAVTSILESISVWWLKHNDDGTVEAIPVTLPDGEVQTWNDQNYVNSFSITITLPYRSSQRL